MKVATNEEHIIKEILVGVRVKIATSKKDLGSVKLWFVSETVLIHSSQTKNGLTLEALRGEGEGVKFTPLDFFGFKFLLLD